MFLSDRSDLDRFAPDRFAPGRFAPSRFALVRSAFDGARGQSLSAPAVPAVSGREDLARLRYANNPLLVARMHGDAHHRRLRLDPVIETLPGLADVITAEDPAVAAAEGRAQGGVQHIRIMRRDPQIAAVGQQ